MLTYNTISGITMICELGSHKTLAEVYDIEVKEYFGYSHAGELKTQFVLKNKI